MKLEAFLSARARQELQSAASWYEDRGSGLGGAFIDEFLSCITRVEDNPEQYLVVDDGIRRALLRRFPYAIYYIIERAHVQILGVLHCNQHPDRWRSRA